MPVIKRKLPDGSTEVINSPSVIIKDPETGKFKKAPTKRYVIPAEGGIAEPQKAPNTEVLPVGTDNLQGSIQSNLAIGSGNNAPIQPFQTPMAPDQVTGSVAFFGAMLARAVQFFTRTGNPSLRGAAMNNPAIPESSVPDNSSFESISPYEAVVKPEKDVTKELELDPKDAAEVEKIKSANQKKKKSPALKKINKVLKNAGKAGKPWKKRKKNGREL